jgi:hypothetical protein
VFIGVNRAISAPSNNIHTYKIRNMAKIREGEDIPRHFAICLFKNECPYCP